MSTFRQPDDLCEIHMTQNNGFVGSKDGAWSMPLLAPCTIFKTCDGPEAFTSTTISKKYGGKSMSGCQERYIQKT